MYRIKMGRIRFCLVLLTLILSLVPSARAADMLLMALDANSYIVHMAKKDLDPRIDLEIVTSSDVNREPEAVAGKIQGATIILADVMGREFTDFLTRQPGLKGKTIYALRGSSDDEDLKRRGFIFDTAVSGYYRGISAPNIKNMIHFVAHRHLDAAIPYDTVKVRPAMGLFHPDAPQIFTKPGEYLAWQAARPGFDPNRPCVGFVFFPAYLTPGQRAPVERIIHRLEACGFNVLPCFGREEQVIENYFLDGGRSRIDMLVSFSFKFNSSLTANLSLQLLRLDVPVFNAVSLYKKSLDEWRKSPEGIDSLQVTWNLAVPEISGVVEPTVLSAKEEFTDKATGKSWFLSRAVDENLNRLIQRLKGWQRLQTTANPDKKIAIMFYNHHQGKQNIGASYLNVFRSIERIVAALRERGYKTGPSLSEKEIKALLLASARNVGSWAPGEVDKLLASGKVIRVAKQAYKTWFNTLPEDFKNKVIKQWGGPEAAGIMATDKDFLIPAVQAGNLVLLPEPARGWGDEPMKLYHDTTLYPHHQYLAVYLWLQKKFKADAMIHLGTHSTYEWTPGKQAGLSPSCAPEVLISDIPNLYPYIVDNLGEGIQAKRRGRGVMISHLTPILKAADIHDEYARMAELAGDIEQAESLGSVTVREKTQTLLDLAEKTGILKDIDAGGQADNGEKSRTEDETVHLLSHYLEEIKSSMIPFGMHTFGVSPAPGAADEMKAALKKWHPEMSNAQIEKFDPAIQDCGPNEIAHLLHGLDGKYVPPGQGNDPVRNPEALPTGNNFFGFNPARMPSPAAWNLGKKAGDQIIAQHLKKHGSFPQKVAVVLWATEALRNQGVNESTILYLIGVKPKWSPAGKVLGMQVMSKGELGHRPRIDVMINASGLYRDLFPDKMLFLDKAIRLASRQTDVENLIARHNAQIKTRLIRQGMDEETAAKLSRFRIFSEPPGAYGNGVSEMASSSALWENQDQVVDVWENRTGYAFGGDSGGKQWGMPAKDLLKIQLSGVDAAVHSKSSNAYGLMDNDDMFQYLGGLSMAVRKESGKAPETLISRQTSGSELAVEDLGKSLGRELRARYLNPKWIRGMKAEGYAGARAMANFVEYLWGWNVTTPEKVDGSKWKQTYEVYVEDKYGMELNRFFADASPWAFQSIVGRMMETHRKGYWQADEKMLKTLAAEYAKSIVAKGIACCEHTCNNPMLNQMVVSIISVPGVVSPEIAEQFKLAVEQMAKAKIEDQVENRKKLLEKRSAPGPDQVRPETVNPAPDQAQDTDMVEGYKMENSAKKEKTTELTSSGMEWFGILAVLAVIGLVSFGIFKK